MLRRPQRPQKTERNIRVNSKCQGCYYQNACDEILIDIGSGEIFKQTGDCKFSVDSRQLS